MPIYEYQLTEGECTRCGGRFTVQQKLSEAPLETCYKCGKKCHRVIAAVGLISSASRNEVEKEVKSDADEKAGHACHTGCHHPKK